MKFSAQTSSLPFRTSRSPEQTRPERSPEYNQRSRRTQNFSSPTLILIRLRRIAKKTFSISTFTFHQKISIRNTQNSPHFCSKPPQNCSKVTEIDPILRLIWAIYTTFNDYIDPPSSFLAQKQRLNPKISQKFPQKSPF
jgi:hypothetical protein